MNTQPTAGISSAAIAAITAADSARCSRHCLNSAHTASIAATGTVMALFQPLDDTNEIGNAQYTSASHASRLPPVPTPLRVDPR